MCNELLTAGIQGAGGKNRTGAPAGGRASGPAPGHQHAQGPAAGPRSLPQDRPQARGLRRHPAPGTRTRTSSSAAPPRQVRSCATSECYPCSTQVWNLPTPTLWPAADGLDQGPCPSCKCLLLGCFCYCGRGVILTQVSNLVRMVMRHYQHAHVQFMQSTTDP